MATTIKPPLKWWGGKYYLQGWIRSLAPPPASYRHRVILCAGGLNEFWNWPHEGVSEVVNDIHGYLVNFYRVLQREGLRYQLQQKLESTPFSRAEFEASRERMRRAFEAARPEDYRPAEPSVEAAYDFFVWNRQSMSGRMEEFTPLTKTRVRRGRNAEVSAWMASIEGMAEVTARLDRVVIEAAPALDVLKREDSADTLFYLDFPYIVDPEAGRTTGEVYHCEADEACHEQTLQFVTGPRFRGKIMISGYRGALYDKYLDRVGWDRKERKIDNKGQKSKVKKTMVECIWRNYE